MKKGFQLFLLFAVLSTSLSSCLKDDSYSLGNFVISYGEIVGDKPDYNIALDNGKTLFVTNNSAMNFPAKDGQRVVAHYTILGDNEDKGYFIRLNGLYEVLTKMPTFSSELDTPEKVDSVGKDPINVNEMWLSSKYLNIEFEVMRNTPNLKHLICLVVDEEKSTDTDVYLTLTHNAFGDAPAVTSKGSASFNILSLVPEGKESIIIHVSNLDYNGQTQVDTGEYKPIRIDL